MDKPEENKSADTPAEAKKSRLWNRNYLLVMLGNFMLYFSFYLLAPLLPIYLDEEFAADKDLIGLVLSGYVVASLLIRPFSGFFVDTFDRKKILMLCFFIFFLTFTGYIGAGTLLMFAVVRTAHGFSFGAATVANSTVAIDVLPSERRNEGIGYYGLSNNAAMAIAPSAGIYIFSLSGNFTLLFWISLAVAGAGFWAVTTVRHPGREPVAEKPKMSLDHFFLGRAWLLALNILLFGLCWGIMSNYVAIYGKERLGITDGTGIFFLLLSCGLFVSRLIGVKSLRRGQLARNALQGAAISACGYTIFATAAGEWTFYAAAILIGLGNGRMYPAFLSMFIAMARHDQRGTANSSILTSWDLGMGLGILLGGVLAEYCSFASAFWASAVSQIAGTLLILCFTRGFFEKRKLRSQ